MPQTRLGPMHVSDNGGGDISHCCLGKPVTCVANRGLGSREVGVIGVDDALSPCSSARLLFLSRSSLCRVRLRPSHCGPLQRGLCLCLRLLRLAELALQLTRLAHAWLALHRSAPSSFPS